MSSLLAIWIDSSQAKFFSFIEGQVVLSHLKPHGPHHHAEVQGKNHTKAQGDTEKFYHQVAEHLQKSPDAKWFVMGSGLGHTHFVHHVQKHHPALAGKIVGDRSVDHMTDGQIQAVAKEFFTDAGLLESES